MSKYARIRTQKQRQEASSAEGLLGVHCHFASSKERIRLNRVSSAQFNGVRWSALQKEVTKAATKARWSSSNLALIFPVVSGCVDDTLRPPPSSHMPNIFDIHFWSL